MSAATHVAAAQGESRGGLKSGGQDVTRSRTVVIVGSGAREHAWAWALSRSPQVARVILAPGNDGMRLTAEKATDCQWEFWDGSVSATPDFERLAARALEARADLVLIGPDDPLARGITNVCEARGLRVFGPSQAAAQIEASKSFSKSVMVAAGVPTAKYHVTQSASECLALLETLSWSQGGWVLKADGLALGKGVIVCATLTEARDAAKKLSAISSTLVVEERLRGQEISWMAFCDGECAVTFDSAADYKRVGEDHTGPNTGGMGAYSPVPGLPADLRARVERDVFAPVLRELKKRGAPFKGLLYAGLMFDSVTNALNVIEFNARMGDPEGEVLLPRVKSDLYDWVEACATYGGLGALANRKLDFIAEQGVYVCAAARGYPDAPEKGAEISGLGAAPEFFSAGVMKRGEKFVVNGGRVLGALGLGATLKAARAQAFARMARIQFAGMHYRRDIADLEKTPIVILASGRGSNFTALVEAAQSGLLCADVRGLICDRPDAEVLVRAKKLGIPVQVIPVRGKSPEDRRAQEVAVENAAREWAPEFLILAGYERILSKEFIDAFRSARGQSRLINIHPSLLPAFPGLHAYRQAFAAGVAQAGVTVHLVETEVDSGPVLAQEAFSLSGCASAADVEARGLAIEHRLFVQTLNSYFRRHRDGVSESERISSAC